MQWYFAAAKWEEILRSKELEYWYQLRPGTTVIFNNHRVLHGRSAFTGLRRICGGYSEFFLFLSSFLLIDESTRREDRLSWRLSTALASGAETNSCDAAAVSMDDFVSRWRNSNLPREEVLAQVIG